jgi:YVTN family beta-propeller protein
MNNMTRKLHYILSILSVLILILSAYSFAEHVGYNIGNSKQNLVNYNSIASSTNNYKTPSTIKLDKITEQTTKGLCSIVDQATYIPNYANILTKLSYCSGSPGSDIRNSCIAEFSPNGTLLNYRLPLAKNIACSHVYMPVGVGPMINNYNSIVPNPNNNLVYISSCFTNNVTVFNPLTNTIVKNISVGKCPITMYLDPLNSILYVVNYNSDNLSLIDTSDNLIAGNISVGKEPTSILYDPFNREIYVSNTLSGYISVVDPNTQKVIKNITTNSEPEQLIMNSDGSCIFADSYSNSSISILNVSSNAVRILTISGGSPTNILYDNESNSIYVTSTSYPVSQKNGQIVYIISLNSNTIKEIYQSRSLPWTSFFDYADNFILVNNAISEPNIIIVNPLNNNVYQSCNVTTGMFVSDYIYNPTSGKQFLIFTGFSGFIISYEIANQTKTISFTEILAIIVVVILASSIGYLVYRRHQFWKD